MSDSAEDVKEEVEEAETPDDTGAATVGELFENPETTSVDSTDDESEADEQAEADDDEPEADEQAEADDDEPEADEQAEADDDEPEAEGEDDRRTSPRKGIQLNKLVAAQLVDGESRTPLYLHLVDLSEGGIRVNGDNELPPDRTFFFDMALEAFGRELAEEYGRGVFPLAVVWQKKLLGGMWVSGLKFVDLDEVCTDIVQKILDRCSPAGRRLRFRLNRVLGVGIGVEDEGTRWLYPLALDLSVEGMKIRIDEELCVGDRFPLKIFLEFDLPTVEMGAEVMWSEELGSGRYQIGLQFTDIDDQNAATVKDYIDRCLEEEMRAGKL